MRLGLVELAGRDVFDGPLFEERGLELPAPARCCSGDGGEDAPLQLALVLFDDWVHEGFQHWSQGGAAEILEPYAPAEAGAGERTHKEDSHCGCWCWYVVECESVQVAVAVVEAVAVAEGATASSSPPPSFVIGELQMGRAGRGQKRKRAKPERNGTNKRSLARSPIASERLRLTGSRLAHVVKGKPTDEALHILVVHGHESKKRPKDELVLTVVYTRVAKDLERRVRPAQEIEQEQGPR